VGLPVPRFDRTHARGRRGQQYRYYVSQSVLKGSAADGPGGADVRLKLEGLGTLARDLAAPAELARAAA